MHLGDAIYMIMQNFTNIEIWVLIAKNILILIAAIIVAKLLEWLIIKLFKFQGTFHLNKDFIDRISSSLTWLLIFLALYSVLPFTQLPDIWVSRLRTILKPASVAVFGWLTMGIINATGKWLAHNYSGKREENWGARRFNTQVRIFTRALNSIIIVLTIIGIALVIPTLREFGMSLFASAGIAGIVLGISAKESLSNLIAGVQLAFTQQILLGDEVVIKDEFGTIEEITSSYVIIKLWDLRRMVVPLRYFMENPFENWTYHEPDIIGTVYLYTDYTVDIEKVRSEALHITKESKLWDGKRCELTVTNSKENTLELRISVSAKNSSDLWDLRCFLRERLVYYLQNQPNFLPKTRIVMEKMEIQ
jgi:small-conductance mechanosensitive channel